MLFNRTAARKRATPDRFGKAVLISPARIARLQQALATNRQPNRAAYDARAFQAPSTKAPTLINPWHVPNAYTDPTGHANARTALQNDANRAYQYGLLYRMTGNEAYALEAVKHIQAWSTITSFNKADDSTLAWCVHFPAFIFGADLVRPSAHFTSEIRAAFETLIRSSRTQMSTAYTHTNNWGAWGILFEASAAAYLKDRPMFDAVVARWKYFVRVALIGGVPFHEVRRQGGGQGNGEGGLWYTHYALMPLTYAAEVMRVNGEYVFDYVSPRGESLKRLWDLASKWSAQPSTFVYNTSGTPTAHNAVLMGHIEMLHNLWPNADSAALLATHRPVDGRHSILNATFTHGDLPLSG